MQCKELFFFEKNQQCHYLSLIEVIFACRCGWRGDSGKDVENFLCVYYRYISGKFIILQDI